MINDKVFFNPGDVVILKHDISNRPRMVVMEKVTRNMISKDGEKDSLFIGIKCRWFTSDMRLQEAIWSTKDLKHTE
jgi:uncharacterized protein YodC (DUF2158 family)